MAKYTGFIVELFSDQLGSIVGTVQSYDSHKIDLRNALVNNKPVDIGQYSVKREFIRTIRIISNCSESVNPTNDSSHQSSRDQRRDRLRNIPSTCNAYVCSKSPPRVIKTPISSVNECAKLQKYNKNTEKCPELHNHQSNAREKPLEVIRSPKYSNSNRNRSMSVGNGIAGGNLSGCESEPSTVRPRRKACQNRNQKKQSFTRPDDSRESSISGWNSIRVEDFIDEDFDFEANLALFDKQAFYEKADSECATVSSKMRSLSVEKVLVEGPNGIGFVSRDRGLAPDNLGQVELVSNSIRTSSILQSSPKPQGDHESTPSSESNPKVDRKACNWYSAAGHRVPVVSQTDHTRLLNYVVTGKEAEFEGTSTGLGWSRVIEAVGQSVVDSALSHIRHSTDSSINRSQNLRAPLRILALADSSSIGCVLALNMARRFSNRGACVFLLSSSNSQSSPSDPAPPVSKTVDGAGSRSSFSEGDIFELDDVYRQEFLLTRNLSPKPAFYGIYDSHYGEETESQSDFDEEDDNELDQSVSLDAFFDTSSQELTPAGRMWFSRFPGLKIVKNKSAVICRPTNMAVDLMLLGQPVEKLDLKLRNWISKHTAISLAIQLFPEPDCMQTDLHFLSKVQHVWFLQLGLPILSPLHFENLTITPSLQLVDIGLTRSLVSRITGNLRALPPTSLFEMGSVLLLTNEKSGR